MRGDNDAILAYFNSCRHVTEQVYWISCVTYCSWNWAG